MGNCLHIERSFSTTIFIFVRASSLGHLSYLAIGHLDLKIEIYLKFRI
jgi:hypothetical protein